LNSRTHHFTCVILHILYGTLHRVTANENVETVSQKRRDVRKTRRR